MQPGGGEDLVQGSTVNHSPLLLSGDDVGTPRASTKCRVSRVTALAQPEQIPALVIFKAEWPSIFLCKCEC